MAGVVVTTAPTQEPLTLQEVKDYLRLADAIDERVLQDLVEASRQFAEEYMARSMMTQTLTLTIDAVADMEDPLWEGWKTGADINFYKNYINLIKSPVQSVTSVKTYNDSDVATTMAASKYYVDSARDQARVVLRTGEAFPTALRVANAIEVVYVAGYTSQSAIPATIRIGLMQHIAYLYEQRGDMGDYLQAREMPPAIKMLYSPYVIHSGMGSSSMLALG
jgi:uncharacterized phiE125 gp8 family phage protein